MSGLFMIVLLTKVRAVDAEQHRVLREFLLNGIHFSLTESIDF